MKTITLLVIALFVISMTHAQQTFNETQKLTASNAGSFNSFGISVAMSDTYVVIGDEKPTHQGSAYVFYKDNGWVQLSEIKASDGENSSFGHSVSVWEDNIVVGDDTKHYNTSVFAGEAYAYKPDNGSWQEQIFIPDGLHAHDYFGKSTAINEQYILVGAPAGDFQSPYVILYKNNNGTWEVSHKLAKPAYPGYPMIGSSVALNNSEALVGDQNHNKVYHYDILSDSLKNEVEFSYGSYQSEFGNSIAMTDDYLMVGCWKSDENGDNSGSVYVFHQVSGFWVIQDTLIPASNSAGDLFGSSIAVSGDYMIIGAQGDSVDGIKKAGSAYIYYNTNGRWKEFQKISASDPVESAFFGCSVAIDSGELVVGAYNAPANNVTNPGAVYVFSNSHDGIAELTGDAINLFPNPASNEINIEFSGNKIEQLRIVDVSGRTVLQKEKIKKDATLDISTLKEGLYFLLVNNGHQLFTRKFVKK